MEDIIKFAALGLGTGAVYALGAQGMVLIYRGSGVINFAHGEFLMLGMYTGLLTSQATGLDPLFTLPVAALVGFLLGVLCYTGFVKYLLRGPMIAQLLGTFGLMLFLRNMALMLFGANDRSLQTGLLVGKSFDIGSGIIVSATKLAVAVLAVASASRRAA